MNAVEMRSLRRIYGVSLADRIRNEEVSGKRGRGSPRLTFENTISMILKEGHVKSTRTPRRACMKRLMTVDEAKEVCRGRSVWSVLSDYPARDEA